MRTLAPEELCWHQNVAAGFDDVISPLYYQRGRQPSPLQMHSMQKPMFLLSFELEKIRDEDPGITCSSKCLSFDFEKKRGEDPRITCFHDFYRLGHFELEQLRGTRTARLH